MNYLEKFSDIYQRLGDLPHEISALDDDILELSMQANTIKQKLTAYEREIVLSNGGFTSLGKNKDARDEKKTQLLAENETYQRALKSLNLAETELELAKKDQGKFTRQYGAVCFQAKLLASFMNYVGATATMPVPQNNGSNGQSEDLINELADLL